MKANQDLEAKVNELTSTCTQQQEQLSKLATDDSGSEVKFDSFFRSPNLQKKLFQKTILSLKFKFPSNYSILLLVGNLNFK